MSNNVKSERKNKNLDPDVKSKALKRAEKEEEQRAAAELKKREKKRGKHMNDLKLKQRAAEKLKLEKKAEEEIQDQEAMQQGWTSTPRPVRQGVSWATIEEPQAAHGNQDPTWPSSGETWSEASNNN